MTSTPRSSSNTPSLRSRRLFAILTSSDSMNTADTTRLFSSSWEYLEGETLLSRLRRHTPLPFDQFASIVTQLLEGLAHIHAHHLVHRDIKPSNIMLCVRRGSPDFVKILDFGLAIETSSSTRLIGSVPYIAPERILGEAVDTRADIYSLGILLFEMIASTRPFCGDEDIDVLYHHLHTPCPPLPLPRDYPEGLDTLILASLSKEPDARPRDADHLLSLMRHLFEHGELPQEFAVLEDPEDDEPLAPEDMDEPPSPQEAPRHPPSRQKPEESAWHTLLPVIFLTTLLLLFFVWMTM